jgi:predicted SAM-dependent methyltransferase
MKLHIGGEKTKEGWSILNAQPKVGVDFVGDIRDLSQFQSNSVDEVYASHVFEHVPQCEILSTLQGICRILKSGGFFSVSVPDMDVLCEHLLDHSMSLDARYHVMQMIFGGQSDAFDFHYFGWNNELLTHYLKLAGFSRTTRVASFGLFEDFSVYKPYGRPISLNILATK